MTLQIIATGMIIMGILVMLTPSRILIKIDRRTGYWIYKRTLEKTRDEAKSLRSAGIFYKIFGGFFAAVGLGILL